MPTVPNVLRSTVVNALAGASEASTNALEVFSLGFSRRFCLGPLTLTSSRATALERDEVAGWLCVREAGRTVVFVGFTDMEPRSKAFAFQFGKENALAAQALGAAVALGVHDAAFSIAPQVAWQVLGRHTPKPRDPPLEAPWVAVHGLDAVDAPLPLVSRGDQGSVPWSRPADRLAWIP